MKHGDITDSGTYAYSAGYGRPLVGNATNVPVRILDRRKEWVHVSVKTGEVRDGRDLYRDKIMRWDDPLAVHRNRADGGMLAEFLDAETLEPTGTQTILLPRDLPCTWDENVAERAQRREDMARVKAAREAERQEGERISTALAEAGVRFRVTTYPVTTWSLDAHQVRDLLALLGQPLADA